MEFPIQELLGYEESVEWILNHFHPQGLQCPTCQQPVQKAREFRQTKRSELTVYRCRQCESIYNLYSGTVFQGRHMPPPTVVMFMRGVCKGEPTTVLASELEIDYKMALQLRHEIQRNAEKAQPETPLADQQTETDEMFQNAGEKRGTPSGPR
jgi:transposase-like protein